MTAPRIEIRNAKDSAADGAWLSHVNQHYVHELTAFNQDFYTLGVAGRYEPDLVPDWLSNPYVTPFIATYEGHRAGFAVVGKRPFEHMDQARDYIMAEFFIIREARARGIGRIFAGELFTPLPGLWHLTVLRGNDRALRFWRNILQHTDIHYKEYARDIDTRFDLTS